MKKNKRDKKIMSLFQLKQLKETEQLMHQRSEFINFGDFTYGKPEVLTWGSNSRLDIGKFCSIATGVKILLGGNHRADWLTTYPFNSLISTYSDIKGSPSTRGDVMIGSDVWIGMDSKIMSGVTIGDGVVIATNSLVTKDLEPYTIYGGSPAKKIRLRFDEETIASLLEMRWWDWKMSNLVEAIPLLQNDCIEELKLYYENKVKKEICEKKDIRVIS